MFWNSRKRELDPTQRVLNSDTLLRSILVKVDSSQDVPSAAKEIVMLFNRYGAVVVEFSQDESPRQQLLCFKEIFGNSMPHDRANEDDIAEIAVSEDFQGYLGTSNLEHSFHTDGAYAQTPPRAVALRCDTPAAKGGVTRLASGDDIYQYLIKEDIKVAKALFAPNALRVSRAGKDSCQALFQRVGDRISIRYRSDETSIPSEDALVREGMKKISAYLENSANSMSFMLTHGQVLITDNLRTLHARTSFDSSEPRKMHRLFFDGSPPKKFNLEFGFTAKPLTK
jgi:alpha-ketoglutarate-dependent taurine dioxygenase